jgi:hypothetical protein
LVIVLVARLSAWLGPFNELAQFLEASGRTGVTLPTGSFVVNQQKEMSDYE